ncbi:MAG TPA: inositol monophosphatase [Sedimentisphaerales bacterium]|jgi:myo-inositol-1(or 4)-monophosphatase|nr:inositol monophosphatase [Sedimentisphaerales bacterium]
MPLEQKDLSEILETAIVAARLAGQHAMEQMGNVKAVKKSENEMVTQADAQCQRIVIQRIRETYPDHGFIAEEGDQGKMFKRPPLGEPAIWWVIDPIDGTHNFIHGIPIFAVSIAAMFQGEPIVGVVFHPGADAMFTAVKGDEAQLDGRHIMAGEEPIGPLTSVGLDSHFDDPLPTWACDLIRSSRFRNFGTTALHLAYVAKGGLVVSAMSTPKLWDIAAGVVIAEAAGAVITDWNGDRIFPVDLDAYAGQPFRVLAGNPRAHAGLLETMRR